MKIKWIPALSAAGILYFCTPCLSASDPEAVLYGLGIEEYEMVSQDTSDGFAVWTYRSFPDGLEFHIFPEGMEGGDGISLTSDYDAVVIGSYLEKFLPSCDSLEPVMYQQAGEDTEYTRRYDLDYTFNSYEELKALAEEADVFLGSVEDDREKKGLPSLNTYAIRLSFSSDIDVCGHRTDVVATPSENLWNELDESLFKEALENESCAYRDAYSEVFALMEETGMDGPAAYELLNVIKKGGTKIFFPSDGKP